MSGFLSLQGFSPAGLFRTLVLTVLLPLLAGVALQTFIPGGTACCPAVSAALAAQHAAPLLMQ